MPIFILEYVPLPSTRPTVLAKRPQTLPLSFHPHPHPSPLATTTTTTAASMSAEHSPLHLQSARTQSLLDAYLTQPTLLQHQIDSTIDNCPALYSLFSLLFIRRSFCHCHSFQLPSVSICSLVSFRHHLGHLGQLNQLVQALRDINGASFLLYPWSHALAYAYPPSKNTSVLSNHHLPLPSTASRASSQSRLCPPNSTSTRGKWSTLRTGRRAKELPPSLLRLFIFLWKRRMNPSSLRKRIPALISRLPKKIQMLSEAMIRRKRQAIL